MTAPPAPRYWTKHVLRDLCEPTELWNPAAQPRHVVKYVDVSAVSRSELAVVGADVITGAAAPSRARKIVRSGDTLFATVRPRLRRVAMIDETLDGEIASTAFCVLRPKRSVIDPRFLYYTVLTEPFVDEVSRHQSGAGYPAVRDAHLFAQVVAIPSLDEQERIAEVLGSLQHRIAIEARLIATTRELKRAAMQQLYRRGLDGEPQKETEIGPLPHSWQVVRLGALGRIGNGSTPKRTNPEYWNDGTLPWLTSGKIHERVISAADEFVTPLAAEECHLPKVPAGSVLVAITGQGKTLGNVATTTLDTFVSQHLAYVTMERDDVDAHFMRHYLSSRYEFLRGMGQAGGSTKGALTCAALKMVPVPLPAVEEQREIVQTLDVIDRKADVHERKLAVSRELFDTLLHDLMTGRLRVGDLDVTVVDDQHDSRTRPKDRTTMRVRLHDQGDDGRDDDTAPRSAEERLAMMWQLTRDAWAFTKHPERAESRLQRHVVRAHRRER